jgi:hypothetical protein
VVVRYLRARGHLAAVRQLQSDLFGASRQQLAPEDRRQKMALLRTEMNFLSAAERQGLRSEGMKHRTAEISRYFALPKEEKTRYLDDLIARGERRRQEWQSRREQDGAQQTPGSPDGQTTPRGGRSGGPLASASERDKRREDMLDSMTATQRAEWTEFRKELNTRRQQLGLPAFGRQ